MNSPGPTPSKPRSEKIRPELTRLPELTAGRRLVRRILLALLRFVVWLFVDIQITGKENIPAKGGMLVVSNHLGDSDLILGVAFSTRSVEVVSKAELHDIPVIGLLMDAYGVIWIHRGQPDRRAMRAVLKGLAEGRTVCIAPEGRESLTGELEEGTHGAAYLALKAGVPVLPVTFTGTENHRVYGNLKRLKRTPMTITIGTAFKLESEQEGAFNSSLDGHTPQDHWKAAIEVGTDKIMQALASQLPPEYQGVYRDRSYIQPEKE